MGLIAHILELKNIYGGKIVYYISHVRIVGESEVLPAPAETRHMAMLRSEVPQLKYVLHEYAVQSNLSAEGVGSKT